MKQSGSNKKYKAIICDVDGTLIPNKRDGMPSEKVRRAIQKVSKVIKVSIATSRPLPYAKHIIKDLDLKSPLVINGGTQIYNPMLKKNVWEKPIPKSSARQVINIFKELEIDLFVNNGINEDIHANDLPSNFHFVQFWAGNLSLEEASRIIIQLNKIPDIISHKIPSWENGMIDIVTTHSEATKQHGILKVAEILKINTHEIIGVGDGYNDFPLLMACGLKVAMGNAVPELKEIADYIAPSVEEDGVADVIERFVLNGK